MDTAWWGIAAVLVIGTAIVVYGWLSDRTATRRSIEELASPPKRPIPGLSPTAEPPQYLSEREASVRPDHLPATDLDADARHSLTEKLAGAPSFPAGWPARQFVTDRATGWSVLTDPLVLVCEEPVTTIRELLPVLQRAGSARRSLVVVAPGAEPEVVATLRANMTQGKLGVLIITLADPDLRQHVAETTGGRTVPHSDLQADYLAEDALGTCSSWVADEDTSWVIHP